MADKLVDKDKEKKDRERREEDLAIELQCLLNRSFLIYCRYEENESRSTAPKIFFIDIDGIFSSIHAIASLFMQVEVKRFILKENCAKIWLFFELDNIDRLAVTGIIIESYSKNRDLIGLETDVGICCKQFKDEKDNKIEDIPNFPFLMNSKFGRDLRGVYNRTWCISRPTEWQKNLIKMGYSNWCVILVACWLSCHSDEQLERWYNITNPVKTKKEPYFIDEDEDLVKYANHKTSLLFIYDENKGSLYHPSRLMQPTPPASLYTETVMFDYGLRGICCYENLLDNDIVSYNSLLWYARQKGKGHNFFLCETRSSLTVQEIRHRCQQHRFIKELKIIVKKRREEIEKELIKPCYSSLLKPKGFTPQPPTAYLSNKDDKTWRDIPLDIQSYLLFICVALQLDISFTKINNMSIDVLYRFLIRSYEIEFGERARMRELLEKEV